MCYDHCRHADLDGTCRPALGQPYPCELEDEDGNELDLGHMASRTDYELFYSERG